MCGIVGIRRFDGGPVDRDLLAEMTSRLAHRGPDDQGFWTEGPIGLGHRRLSIIDVEHSHQPMASVDGRARLAFNGEILNYRSLRSRLDYPYRTGGDTEVILAAFQAFGSAAAAHLEGQFAFGLYDRTDDALWLARDRMGVLPLYYYADADVFVFASEIKALLPALPKGPEIDERSLDDYLAHRSVPAPHTLFRGVRKLPPAHVLRVGAHRAGPPRRYWSLPDPTDAPIGDATAVEQVERTLTSAVESALVADVPVGAYLSGGVDSSLIVALMSTLRRGEGVKTFAAGFGDERYDELVHARQVADRLGTNHHEVMVTPDDFEALWSTLTWHRDAPISQPADVAVYRLAERARQEVTVVLSGEGSDELFGGYPKHRFAAAVPLAGAIPPRARERLIRTVEQRLPGSASRARIALRALSGSDEHERRRGWFAPFTERERRELLRGVPDTRRSLPLQEVSGDPLRRMLHADSQAWLADNLLERGDRMSMAASLELRPPFLDRKMVELAFALPSRVKVRRGETKWVVKQVAQRHLPDEIVRRRKVGFQVPLDAWFRGGLEEMAWDVLTAPQSFVSEVLDREAVFGVLDRHRRGQSNEDVRIWTLVCLEVWHGVFFKDAPVRDLSRPAV
jgi:asparagine synthase (glutamine-hydrolysing)